MRNPFKKGQKTREQKAEELRFKTFVKETLWPLIASKAENAYQPIQFMKAVQVAFAHNTELRMAELKKEIDKSKFGELNIKALEGKYSEEEQAIIDCLSDESVETVNRLISRWQPIMDSVIREELLKRPISSLEVHWD